MSKWISVKDEQPPHEENVLLGWWREWPELEFIQEVRYFSCGKRTRLPGYGGSISNYHQHGSATHWMPLPEPSEIKRRK